MTSRVSTAGGVASLGAACWNLIRSWWRVDAIRVSPTAGQLLRLGPADLFEWSEALWQVESRAVGTGSTGPFVSYRCRSGDRNAVLVVTPSLSGTERVSWVLEGKPMTALPNEFRVWSATQACVAP